MDETKPWYLSRTIIGALVSLLCTVGGTVGLSVVPELQGDITEWLLAAGGLVGGALTIYGRIKASKAIGKGGTVAAKLAVAFLLLGGVALGGPMACANLELRQAEAATPAQRMFALQADYNTAMYAVLGYLESGYATPETKRAIAWLDQVAFQAIANAADAVRSGDGLAIAVSTATAKAALDELVDYLEARKRDGPAAAGGAGVSQPGAGT